MTETELARDDEDVVPLLLLDEFLERLNGPFTLAKTPRPPLDFAPVIECPFGCNGPQHLAKSYVVVIGTTEILPSRDGEPSLGAVRQRLFGNAGVIRCVSELWKELTQYRHLLPDSLDLIALGVCISWS